MVGTIDICFNERLSEIDAACSYLVVAGVVRKESPA